MIDGALALPIRPSTMKSISSANSRRTASALLNMRLPLRFALVETMAVRANRHSRAASRWAVTRTAMVSLSPRNHRDTPRTAGSNQVFRPGHESRICLRRLTARKSAYIDNWLQRSAININPLARARRLIRRMRRTAATLRGSQPRPKHASVGYATTPPQRITSAAWVSDSRFKCGQVTGRVTINLRSIGIERFLQRVIRGNNRLGGLLAFGIHPRR